MSKAIIICRCSTDEARQDVELQVKPCVDYCSKQGWDYEVLKYYGSASKGVPVELQGVLDSIAQRKYDVVIVYSMDRFSRLKPSVTERMLNHITECKVRFISILENLDSDNPLIWYAMKGLWIYFANLYSVNLSKKVKDGMEKANKEIEDKGFYISGKTGKKITSLGRPKGSIDKRQRSKKGYFNRVYKFNAKGSNK